MLTKATHATLHGRQRLHIVLSCFGRSCHCRRLCLLVVFVCASLAPFEAGPCPELVPYPAVRKFHSVLVMSLLVFEHLGCLGRVAMYKKVALLLRLSLLLSFHLLRNQRPPDSSGKRLGEPDSSQETPLRSWPPRLLYSILRLVRPSNFLLCNCPV